MEDIDGTPWECKTYGDRDGWPAPMPGSCGRCALADAVSAEDAWAIVHAVKRCCAEMDCAAAIKRLQESLVVCQGDGWLGRVMDVDEGACSRYEEREDER